MGLRVAAIRRLRGTRRGERLEDSRTALEPSRGALPGEGLEPPLEPGEPLLQIRDLVPPGHGEAPHNWLDDACRLPLEPRQNLHPARVELIHHPRAALAEIRREPSGLR